MGIDLDQIKSKVVNVAAEVTDKAKDMSATAKLKLDIHSKEEYLTKQYAAIGKKFYEEHVDDEEMADRADFANVKEALLELEKMQAELDSLQNPVV